MKRTDGRSMDNGGGTRYEFRRLRVKNQISLGNCVKIHSSPESGRYFVINGSGGTFK